MGALPKHPLSAVRKTEVREADESMNNGDLLTLYSRVIIECSCRTKPQAIISGFINILLHCMFRSCYWWHHIQEGITRSGFIWFCSLAKIILYEFVLGIRLWLFHLVCISCLKCNNVVILLSCLWLSYFICVTLDLRDLFLFVWVIQK